MRNLVKEHGTKHWKEIAISFNRTLPKSDRSGKQCRDRWLNYLAPNINKEEVTDSERYKLCHYWLQLGNSWVKISRSMGRTENWVKNNWKKLLKKEGIDIRSSSEEIREKIASLADSLKSFDGSAIAIKQQPIELSIDASSAYIPEELEQLDPYKDEIMMSESDSYFSDALPNYEIANGYDAGKQTEGTKKELMKATIMDSENFVILAEKKEDDACERMADKPIRVSSESEDYDYAENTSEKKAAGSKMQLDMQDIGKYVTTKKCPSPFQDSKQFAI